MSNPFFKNHGPFKISQISKLLNVDINKSSENIESAI